MKTSIKTVLLGSTTLLAMGVAGHQANAATTGVPIEAIILDPVAITQTRSLNFGSLTEAGVGTAVIDNADGITVGGAVTSIGGTIQSGGFTVKGSTGRQIDITTPATVNITRTAGPETMSVDSFRLTAPAAGGAANNTGTAAAGASIAATLTAASVTGFRLGGTLNVGAGQVAGTYQGSVTVTAVYN